MEMVGIYWDFGMRKWCWVWIRWVWGVGTTGLILCDSGTLIHNIAPHIFPVMEANGNEYTIMGNYHIFPIP